MTITPAKFLRTIGAILTVYGYIANSFIIVFGIFLIIFTLEELILGDSYE